MRSEIEEFIQRGFPNDCNWLNGNCYHFALILSIVFNLPIIYFPIDGHFAVIEYDNNNVYFYDYNGCHIYKNEIFYYLDQIQKEDIIWYNRLVRDCMK